MKTCRVIPDSATCNDCLEIQSTFDIFDDCNRCESSRRIHDLIKVDSNFWGSYAVVSIGGKKKKVSLWRVIDIKN